MKVAWDPVVAPRDWYFYTYRTTVVETDAESEESETSCGFCVPWRTTGLRVVSSATLLGSEIRDQD